MCRSPVWIINQTFLKNEFWKSSTLKSYFLICYWVPVSTSPLKALLIKKWTRFLFIQMIIKIRIPQITLSLEIIELETFYSLIFSTDNHFGFIAKHQTSVCIFAAKGSHKYRHHKSSVALCFIVQPRSSLLFLREIAHEARIRGSLSSVFPEQMLTFLFDLKS